MKTALALLVLCGTAHANNSWQIGVQLTSDADTQQARLGGGIRLGAWKLGAVVDAQTFADGSDDIDAVVEYSPRSDAWSLLAGWRTCAIAIERGRQWHQQFLVGVTGNLPAFWAGRIQPSFGTELVTTIVRHGDELDTDWISLASQRHFRDTISMNLFLRFDYVSAL